MVVGRPNPDELLTRVQRDESRHARGRLKIFFGMAPGVGKTYAMLAAAHRLASEGHDVVIGLVHTHGRIETEQQLLGLDLLPLRAVEYRGVTVKELDLDAALARKPEILLVDELAHTNAPGPGGRFEKRWQDVQELVNAGINVFTTLNVQHIESLNDVVAQITGVQVRETVPDAVVEEADEIELVDLPPEALLERLKAGKVYVPDTIQHAIDSFFRKGNLTALRQLALRRTAEWVDRRMQEYKEGQGIRTVWPAVDRVLVCVSPSPTSVDLVRAARRMAAGLRADLIAVYIETPRSADLPQQDRDRVLKTMRVAESLGAEAVTLSLAPGSSDAVAEIVSFARARNVTKIVIGKTDQPRWRTALFGSFMEQVIRQSGEIDVHVIRGEEDDRAIELRPSIELRSPAGSGSFDRRWSSSLGGIGCVAASTVVAWVVFSPPDLSDESMIYLAGVVVAAWRFGRRASVLASVLSVLAFNFFFTEPRFTFAVDDPRYLITLAVMLVAGLLVGTLTARTRDQAQASRQRERRTGSLYAMSRELAIVGDQTDIARIAVKHIDDTFAADAAILLPRGGGASAKLEPAAASGSPDWLDERELSVARWALDRGEPAGAGTRAIPGAAGRYLPLTTSRGRLGVLALRPREPEAISSTPQLVLLETFADQIAVALERVILIQSRQTAQVEAERERLRNALLSSVSHDLRTPLAGIAGSASALAQSDATLDPDTRHELTQSIVDEANRLNDLIGNLVFATRLESGIDIKREWTTVEEIVGAGLARHRGALATRPFTTAIPADLPMIRGDAAMLSQVVFNLVDNALRHTPPGTPMRLSAWPTDQSVIIAVADEGPGLAETERDKVFQRHYRGRPAQRGGSLTSTGMGLGLTICEGIIKAHGGRLWAETNTPRGATFMFALPIERPQPIIPREGDEPTSPMQAADQKKPRS